MKNSKFYFGAGGTKKQFSGFFWIFFTKKGAENLGITGGTTGEARGRKQVGVRSRNKVKKKPKKKRGGLRKN